MNAPPRRFVLLHTTGPWAGMHQICGVEEAGGGLPDESLPAQIPAALTVDGREVPAGLMLATPTYVVYRELDAL